MRLICAIPPCPLGRCRASSISSHVTSTRVDPGVDELSVNMSPRLRSDGTLPPGAHQVSLADVLIAFPARNQQRQMLNDALTRVVEQLWQLDFTLTILVDG